MGKSELQPWNTLPRSCFQWLTQPGLTTVQPCDRSPRDDEDVGWPKFRQPHEEVPSNGEDIHHQHGFHPARQQQHSSSGTLLSQSSHCNTQEEL